MVKQAGDVLAEDAAFAPVGGKRLAPEFLSAAFRMWLVWLAILLVPTLVAAGAAYVGAALMPRVYAAQADLVFSLPDTAAVPEQYRSTQVIVAKSHAVLQPAATVLKMPIERLAASLSVDFPKAGGVFRLQYADGDRAVALHALEAILDQYVLVLDQLDTLDVAAYRLLTPPFVVEDAISPRPTLLAALGAAFGLAIGLGALAVILNLRRASPDGRQ